MSAPISSPSRPRSSTWAISGQANARASAHGVADVVVVAVRDEDRVDPLRLQLGGRAGRVAGEPRIDVDAVARRGVETEGGVAEPGEVWLCAS